MAKLATPTAFFFAAGALIVTLIFSSCKSLPADPAPNPADTTRPGFIPPKTKVSSPTPGEICPNDYIDASWAAGNASAKLFFRFRVNQKSWSTWSSLTIYHLEFLEEGVNSFGVQSENDGDVTEVSFPEVFFTVASLPSQSIFFNPRNCEVNSAVSTKFAMPIKVKQISKLLGVRIVLDYDKGLLIDTISTWGGGPYFPNEIDTTNRVATEELVLNGLPPDSIIATVYGHTAYRYSTVLADTLYVKFDKAKTEFVDVNGNSMTIGGYHDGRVLIR